MGNGPSSAGSNSGSADVKDRDDHGGNLLQDTKHQTTSATGHQIAEAPPPPALGVLDKGPSLVFLSHSGKQKRGFVGWLKKTLNDRYPEVTVFLDEEGLELGGASWTNIEYQLKNAAVVVFVISEAFLTTPSTMKELELCVDQARKASTNNTQAPVIIPVLYDVTYEELDNFYANRVIPSKWEERGLEWKESVQYLYSTVIQDVSKITLVRRDQAFFEHEIAGRVVNAVVARLRSIGKLPTDSPSFDLPHTVGLEEKVDEVIEQLHTCGLVLLWGMGGIGKTTCAKTIYERLKNSDLSYTSALSACFISMQYELTTGNEQTGMTEHAITERQWQLLKHVLGKDCGRPDTAANGKRDIACNLKGKKLLLVVDNVWQQDLNRLLPLDIISDVLAAGSMLLVTSRSHDVAGDFKAIRVPGRSENRAGGASSQPVDNTRDDNHPTTTGSLPATTRQRCVVVPMDLLSKEQSMELFLWHVFDVPGTDPTTMTEEHEILAKQIVQSCGGLPQALEVTGRHLGCSLDPDLGQWKQLAKHPQVAFARTGAIGRQDSQATLSRVYDTSYNSLDATDQKLLLDISFFLKGQPWEAISSYDDEGARRLMQRSLVKQVPVANQWHETVFTSTVWVHDTLVLFCGAKDLDNRQRVDLKFNNGASGLQVKAALNRASKHKELLGLSIAHTRQIDLPTEEGQGAPPLPLQTECLRVLLLEDTNMKLEADGLQNVQWLTIDKCGRTQGSDSYVGSLVDWSSYGVPELSVLQLSTLQDERLDPLLQMLEKPKFIHISYMPHLKTVPVKCTSLQHLSLFCCDGLRTIDLVGLASLKTLTIWHCNALTSVSEFSHLTDLQCLFLVELPQLSGLPGAEQMTSLQRLVIRDCTSLTSPPDLSNCAKLKQLSFQNSFVGAHKLTGSLSGLTSLTRLGIRQLTALVELPGLNSLPASIREISIRRCQLKELDVSGLSRLTYLEVHTCPVLKDIVGLAELSALRTLDLADLLELERLQSAEQLTALQLLVVRDCKKLPQLPVVSGLRSLERFVSSGMTDSLRPCSETGDCKVLSHLSKVQNGEAQFGSFVQDTELPGYAQQGQGVDNQGSAGMECRCACRTIQGHKQCVLGLGRGPVQSVCAELHLKQGSASVVDEVECMLASHDQGYSDLELYRGTYDLGWTFGICKILHGGQELYSDHFGQNLQAVGQVQVHKMLFTNKSQVVKAINRGVKDQDIVIQLHAASIGYGCWANHVADSSITVRCTGCKGKEHR